MDRLGYQMKRELNTPFGLKPKSKRRVNEYSSLDAGEKIECCTDSENLCPECQVFADIHEELGL